MKRLFLLVALAAATLGAAPCSAQQGPAGVPGVFGLAASVTSVPPASTAPPPRAAPTPQPPAQNDCATSKQPEQCQMRQEARNKMLSACQGKAGAALKQCLSDYQQNMECKKASDPALCVRHQKAHRLCAQKFGPEHRQCLRDNLAPKN